MFSLHLNVENSMWKYSQEGVFFFFFCLTYMEPKYQSNKHNQGLQMMFKACLDTLSMLPISHAVWYWFFKFVYF